MAAVTHDSVIVVERYAHEETVGQMLWRADQVRQEQLLHPETFLDRCKVRRDES